MGKACELSLDLATIEGEEIQQFESYFWYIVLHWPTPSEQNEAKISNTYEENRIESSILKLKRIQDRNSYFVQPRREKEWKRQQHNPIFNLKNDTKFDKLTTNHSQ